jgi:hypothetical protein
LSVFLCLCPFLAYISQSPVFSHQLMLTCFLCNPVGGAVSEGHGLRAG